MREFEQEVDFMTRELPGKDQVAASRPASATFFEPYLWHVEEHRLTAP